MGAVGAEMCLILGKIKEAKTRGSGSLLNKEVRKREESRMTSRFLT